MTRTEDQNDAPPSIEWSEQINGNDLEIELIFEEERWSEINSEFAFLKKAALLALSQEPAKTASSDLAALKSPHRLAVLVLSNDATVRDLNKSYRDKDRATNILSFPSTEALMPGEECEPVHIGDAILAYEYVKNEAENEKKEIKSHISHLVIHGVLHLLGYDHEESDEAEAMETLEISLMKQLGLEDPYSLKAVS